MGDLRTPLDDFRQRGFADPLPVLTAEDARRLLAELRRPDQSPPLDWSKGRAASSRAFYEIGAHPVLADFVAQALGGDVLFWGADLLVRIPGAVHPWHTDIETSSPAGRCVTVWLGLEHTSQKSALKLVPFSHHFGVTLQEVAQQHGKRRGEVRDEEIGQWARCRNAASGLVTPPVRDGEALIFDGRLWHGSHNLDDRNTRVALLLQYAAPETPIRIPDFSQLEWPFRQFEEPRPPCVLLRGSDHQGRNRIVVAPGRTEPDAQPYLTSRVIPPPGDMVPDPATGWRPHPIFHGSTADLDLMGCHCSVLAPGRRPHDPHRHREEEILLVLEGEIELELPDRPVAEGGVRQPMGPGDIAFFPAHYAHTHTCVSGTAARYVMFKWRAGAEAAAGSARSWLASAQDGATVQSGPGFRSRLLAEGPTGYLRHLHAHGSDLAPGAGYEPHADAFDVALVILEGEVETLGRRVGPHGVVFYAAGEPHGLRNPGNSPARYVVFEFHASPAAYRSCPRPRARSWWDRLRARCA